MEGEHLHTETCSWRLLSALITCNLNTITNSFQNQKQEQVSPIPPSSHPKGKEGGLKVSLLHLYSETCSLQQNHVTSID